MRALGVDMFIECGPGRVLSGLIRRCCQEAKVLNVENLKSLAETRSALQGRDWL